MSRLRKTELGATFDDNGRTIQARAYRRQVGGDHLVVVMAGKNTLRKIFDGRLRFTERLLRLGIEQLLVRG